MIVENNKTSLGIWIQLLLEWLVLGFQPAQMRKLQFFLKF